MIFTGVNLNPKNQRHRVPRPARPGRDNLTVVSVTLWVIVFVALGAAALIALGVCALPVWREGKALMGQLGQASARFEEDFAPLGEALEALGETQSSPAAALTKAHRR